MLKRHPEGLHLGSSYIGSPTCADDVLLTAMLELAIQDMMDTEIMPITTESDKIMRYKINPINPRKTIMAFLGRDQET